MSRFFRGGPKCHPFLQIGRGYCCIWTAPENPFVGRFTPSAAPTNGRHFQGWRVEPPQKMDFVGAPYPSLKISIKIWAPSSSSWAGYSGYSVRSIRTYTRSIRALVRIPEHLSGVSGCVPGVSGYFPYIKSIFKINWEIHCRGRWCPHPPLQTDF